MNEKLLNTVAAELARMLNAPPGSRHIAHHDRTVSIAGIAKLIPDGLFLFERDGNLYAYAIQSEYSTGKWPSSVLGKAMLPMLCHDARRLLLCKESVPPQAKPAGQRGASQKRNQPRSREIHRLGVLFLHDASDKQTSANINRIIAALKIPQTLSAGYLSSLAVQGHGNTKAKSLAKSVLGAAQACLDHMP